MKRDRSTVMTFLWSLGITGSYAGNCASMSFTASAMSSETRGVKMAATKEGITITSDNPDLGEVREELEADYSGEPIAIGFNPKYVVELLGQMGSDQVTLKLGGELDPGLIEPTGGDAYLGVVMPMRI